MKLRHAALVPCVLALAACTAVTGTPNVDLAGRSLMWADGATEECEVPPTLTFGTDGQVSGNASCNYLTGGWTVKGDQIDLSQLGSTRRLCGRAIMKMEDAFLTNLGKTVYVEADGDKVKFLDAERNLVMTLVPEAPGSCK